MLTRKSGTRATGLPLDLTDLLLDVQRPEAEIAALNAQGVEYDTFLEFFVSDTERAVLRHEHAAYLRAEAARRGIQFPKAGNR